MSEQEGYEALAEAEGLLARAEEDPAAARAATVSALRSLLLEWGETPSADTVTGQIE
jgi:hypothetical protein